MAATKNTIPPDSLKLNYNTYVESLQNPVNECLTTDNFSENLKLADIRFQFFKRKIR